MSLITLARTVIGELKKAKVGSRGEMRDRRPSRGRLRASYPS
jgi:hypothetical protein